MAIFNSYVSHYQRVTQKSSQIFPPKSATALSPCPVRPAAQRSDSLRNGASCTGARVGRFRPRSPYRAWLATVATRATVVFGVI